MEPTTGTGTSDYIYSPLSSKTSIRLLNLLPGRGDVIECEILECSVDNPTSYQALSYSWGSDENSKTIACAGKQYLRVRSNLYHALWFIRDPTISKTLWVDAICIDQGNVLERNHQVSQMTAIYTKAEKLIIWLGNENNDVAVKFIARLATTAQNQNANHGMLIKPRIHRSEWQALRKFLNASWFRRMWVVQELVLGLQMEGPMATEILLGQHSVLWVELVRCCEWTKDNYASLAMDAATALISDSIYSSIERVLHLHHMALQREQGQQT
ncbi:heterokaryon incompatibility protein-domain-containing protein [Paraphoma chrysanthemicola]|uniref:Heterokaryon incompatibility protein-domain-containing protein n=1 Tax=Paraphoma chrysanthemicola TaxID=798071 RepID=A0A8K0RER2_9PLEO|nr:heterokaryon incompatibility protein-domain-containing protein [Paraphoma chrysanthemicola]